MSPSTELLSLLAVVFIHLFFAMAMLQDDGHKPLWVLLYFLMTAFFGALYFHRRLWLRHQRGAVYNGFGYAAVMLVATLSALLFFSAGAAMPLPLAMCVWLALAIAAFYFYRVIVLHLDDDEALQAPGAISIPPV